jgi:predicted secreted protein
MRCIPFCLKIVCIIFLALPSFATQTEIETNENITELFLPNWPYQAFLAIPRISEMKPILAIVISQEDTSLNEYNCVELYYFKMKKKFETKAILDRKSLHELLCKSMKRAILKIDKSRLSEYLKLDATIALQFDFFNGYITSVEIPYPPLDSLEKLQDVFLDEDGGLIFGDIDLPEELTPEISQSPL